MDVVGQEPDIYWAVLVMTESRPHSSMVQPYRGLPQSVLLPQSKRLCFEDVYSFHKELGLKDCPNNSQDKAD